MMFYRELLQLNSSNYKYYIKILEAHGFTNHSLLNKLSEQDQEKVKEIFATYEKNLPKATAHHRLQLNYLQGELFREKFIQYATPLIIKGVPPTIQDVKELYVDSDKVRIIGEVMNSMLNQMGTNNTLFGKPDEEEHDPTVTLWLMYYLSQHYLF